MSFRGSLCLTFSYHIHGSDTDYLAVFMKQEEETSVVFHEGLYDYNKWQKAHVMLVANGTFQVGAGVYWFDSKGTIRAVSHYEGVCAPERTCKPSQAQTLLLI